MINTGKSDNGTFDEHLSARDFLIMKALRGVMLCTALLVAYWFVGISYEGLMNFQESDAEERFLTLATSYAWLAFFVMGVFWVFDKRIGWFFPVTGAAAGMLSMAMTFVGFFFAPWLWMMLVPLVIFARHLMAFHVNRIQSFRPGNPGNQS